MKLEPAFPELSLSKMVYLTEPDDSSNRLFLVLQPGKLVVIPNDRSVASATTFLDITDRVNDRRREEGLLGLAFDPEVADNGYFYVYYTASGDRGRRSVISRFSISATNAGIGDPDSELIVMEVPQPASNHNGGQIEFGPDGFLYVGLGDGGSAGDPSGNGQNLSTLLGSILRIDISTLDQTGTYSIPPDNPFVGHQDARPEIWAYGLRNPWRFSFDTETGELWVGDVGQNRLEEIDIVRRGGNYGWNTMEGFDCFEPRRNCDQTALVLPIIDYDHGEGCSVTGGYVYRGSRLPSLQGAYVYGDFCSGKIWALRFDGSSVTEHLDIVGSGPNISSFGVDASGEIYVLAFDDRIYRLVPR